MSNAVISEKVTPLVDAFINIHLEPRGFTSSMSCIIDNEEDRQSKLMLCDPADDIGTYQFYYDDMRGVVVANYFDSSIVYGTYKDGKQFEADYDLPITFDEIEGLLHLLYLDNASAYIGIDSKFIDHSELLARDGWTDRRIKTEFGIVPKCELDRVSYYRLNEVIQKEQ
ncbi:hypothetical protein ACWKXX_07580 [Enterobacter sp. UPMP2061]